MEIKLARNFRIITAYTGCVVYSSANTIHTITNCNINSNIIYYDENILTDRTINKDKPKYNYCVDSGIRERGFLLQYFITNRINNFFISDEKKSYDNFDAVYICPITNRIKLIEVKFRSHKYNDDFLFEEKYKSLFRIKNLNRNKNIDVIYFCIYPDYSFRSYKLNNLWLEFDTPKEIADHPGSSKKKIVINCVLDTKYSKQGKIIFF